MKAPGKEPEQIDPFLLRALAKAALVLCFQFRKPPRIPVSLWATASGLPITSAHWQRLERRGLIAWKASGWMLTAEGAHLLQDARVKVPVRLISGHIAGSSEAP